MKSYMRETSTKTMMKMKGRRKRRKRMIKRENRGLISLFVRTIKEQEQLASCLNWIQHKQLHHFTETHIARRPPTQDRHYEMTTTQLPQEQDPWANQTHPQSRRYYDPVKRDKSKPL
jgi:hypothetical protein